MFCPKCGKEQLENPRFCRSCGECLRSDANRAADIGRNEVLDDIEILQSAADYNRLKRELIPVGIVSIIFGLPPLILGILNLAPIQILLGVFPIIMGVWVIASPKPAGILAEGITLVILGVSNILLFLLNLLGGGHPVILVIFGVGLIVLGIRCFTQLKSYWNKSVRKPSLEVRRRFDEIAKSIKKEKANKSTDTIQFKARRLWKGKLYKDRAIFVGGGRVLFAKKPDVDFVKSGGETLIGKKLKVTFLIRDLEMCGTISPEFFQRFEAWKAA